MNAPGHTELSDSVRSVIRQMDPSLWIGTAYAE